MAEKIRIVGVNCTDQSMLTIINVAQFERGTVCVFLIIRNMGVSTTDDGWHNLNIMINVFITDDHGVLIDGLRMVIKHEADLNLSGTAKWTESGFPRDRTPSTSGH